MTYLNDDQPETLPDPWRSPITRQLFTPMGRWHNSDVELIDWRTACRECGEDHYFVLKTDHPDQIATEVSLRWHGICHYCRMGLGR